MTPLGHVAVASLIPASPALAFAAGIISHAVFDVGIAEPKFDWTSGENLWRWFPYIILEAAGSLLLAWWTGRWWAALGGLFPDLWDAAAFAVDRRRWLRGESMFPWHQARTQTPLSWPQVWGLEAAMVLVAVVSQVFR